MTTDACHQPTTGDVLAMRAPGPNDTDLQRREARLVCGRCEARILPGDLFRVTSIVNFEITEGIHVRCERRRWNR